MDEFCTPQDPPVHNLILGSEIPMPSRGLSDFSMQTAVEVAEMMPQYDFWPYIWEKSDYNTIWPDFIWNIHFSLLIIWTIKRTNFKEQILQKYNQFVEIPS